MNQFSQFVMHHWQLWIAFVALLILVLIYELIAQKKKAKEISPQIAVSLINNEDAVVIDLREKEAFKNGHIIDSINASVDEFKLEKMAPYKNKIIILACARGLQATAAAAKIKHLGFKPLVLRGGIISWQNADLPLTKR